MLVTLQRGWEEGTILGNAVEACIVKPAGECSSIIGTVTTVRQISTPQEHNRWKKFWEMIGESDLSEQAKNLLCEFLMDHHDVFALEDADRGETDLIQLEIDMCFTYKAMYTENALYC